MCGSTAEAPDKKAVDGSEGEIACSCRLTCALDLIQNPSNLGAGEVGVEHKPRLAAEQLFQALLLQLCAQLGGTTTLPDDRVMHGTVVATAP